ncbi:hypothetical protein QUF86_23015 [Peribacillus sp. NJ11]|uniref:hypothetical protein n=1 Tax=Peribacillus sp. NJ11 TaxID=3055861 RepID=UPI0025A04E5C|nr:hypothetical protein [Peribacillus sp. NJ11]MDM5223547.1 hypothetical protein [Peribacillus sp. NJ11]
MLAYPRQIIPMPRLREYLFRTDLTGTWVCDDGGEYYIRQIQNSSLIYWVGLSQRGVGDHFANVFRGVLDPAGVITGKWTDVPYARANSLGSITLRVEDDGRKLRAIQKTGGFGGSVWTKQL